MASLPCTLKPVRQSYNKMQRRARERSGEQLGLDRPASRLRYCVANGNSADLIRRQFRLRKGWSPFVPGQGKDSSTAKERQQEALAKADFVWCQYRSSLGEIPSAKLANSQPGKRTRSLKSISNRLAEPIINHFDSNKVVTSKKGLLETLSQRPETLDFAPRSYQVNADSEEILAWQEQGQDTDNERLFIVKPGSGTNRGVGIFLARSRNNVAKELIERLEGKDSKRKTWIVQEYIERPLLVHGRKFDIRCYVLLILNKGSSSAASTKKVIEHVTNQGCDDTTQPNEPEVDSNREAGDGLSTSHSQLLSASFSAEPNHHVHDGFQLYLHEQAYVRTSSRPYSIKNFNDRLVHLTNDAVQNKASDYGTIEAGNKLSMTQLAEVLDAAEGEGAGKQVMDSFWPQICTISKETFLNALPGIQPTGCGRRFELFGLDFMITDDPGIDRRVKLIEINENPCLERVCPLLSALIPRVIDDTFDIVMDQTFFPCEEPLTTRTSNGYKKLF